MDENTLWQELEIDPVSRMQLAEVIIHYAQASKPIIASMMEALDDPSESIRGRAAQAFGRLGYLSEPVVAALLTKLERDLSIFVRACAIESLGKLRCSNNRVILALVEALKDDELCIQEYSAKTLGSLLHSSSAVTLVLLDALKNEHPDVRAGVARALGYIEHPSKPLMSALFEVLNDELWSVRASAVEALVHAAPVSQLCEAAILEIASDGRIDVLKTIESKIARRENLFHDNLVVAGRLLAYIPYEKTKDGQEIILRLRDLAVCGDPWTLPMRVLAVLAEINSRALVDFLVQKASEEDKNTRKRASSCLRQLEHAYGAPRPATLSHTHAAEIYSPEVASIILDYDVSHPNSGMAELLDPLHDVVCRVLEVDEGQQISEQGIWEEFLFDSNPEPLVKILMRALSYHSLQFRAYTSLLGDRPMATIFQPSCHHLGLRASYISGSVAEVAVETLGWLGISDRTIVESLIRALETHRTNSVRKSAAWALRVLYCWSPSRAIIDALCQALHKDHDSDVRLAVAAQLIQLGHISESVISVVLHELRHGITFDELETCQPKIQHARLAFALGPPYQQEAVLAMIQCLQYTSPDDDEMKLIAGILGAWGRESDKVIDILVSALCDTTRYASPFYRLMGVSDIRAGVVRALGLTSRASEVVVDALLMAVRDRNEEVRAQAAESLGRLGYVSQPVIDGLLTALKDREGKVQAQAAEALGQLGHGSPQVIDGLVSAIQDRDVLDETFGADVGRKAAAALATLGQSHESVINGLLDVAERHSQTWTGVPFVQAIGSFEELPEFAIARLLQILQGSAHRTVRLAVAQLLARVEEVSETAVAVLLQERAVEPLWYISRKSGRRFSPDDLPDEPIGTTPRPERTCLIFAAVVVAAVAVLCILCLVLWGLLSMISR